LKVFCKVDGRDGIIVGSGPGFRRGTKTSNSPAGWEPCTKLLVILAGAKYMAAVDLSEAELYGLPKKLRKLHKKLLRRAEGVVEG